MENNIDITELLKDCPEGTELYSPIFGNVYLCRVRPSLAVIVRVYDRQEEFLYDGRFGMNGECMLFPSKENRDWSTFKRPFKDGDIAISDDGDIHLLRTSDSSYCAYREHWQELPKFDSTITTCITVDRLANEKEKQKLFSAIKANGYRWNSETKTLEKLPKFKMGDIITNGKNSIIIDYIDDKYYYEVGRNIATRLCIKNQDEWKLVKPKFKVGDKIKKYEYGFIIAGVKDNCYITKCGKKIPFTDQDSFSLVPNKFNITTLKPFAEVLVRLTNNCVWMPKFFSHYDTDPEMKCYPFITTDNIGYVQCIPYKGNEYLCRTTNNCSDFYKNW